MKMEIVGIEEILKMKKKPTIEILWALEYYNDEITEQILSKISFIEPTPLIGKYFP